jgi:hypothetical protein
MTATEYAVVNVGGYFLQQGTATEYATVNVGLFTPPSTLAVEYSVVNLDTGTPPPVIFGTTPLKSRTGDMIDVIGTGFGQPQSQFLGIVQGQNDLGEWQNLTPTSWTRVAATGDAYNDNRTIDTSLIAINVEHDKVQIQIPNWATPPNLPIRIITDG